MSNIEATATLNQKEQPNTLTVVGTLYTPNEKDTVHLEEVTPPATKPTILLLKAVVKSVVSPVPAPMKMTQKKFIYIHKKNAASYKQVNIEHEKDSITIDVARLG